ncbi:MAG: fibronectin type III domain-containing protein [candidate division Zixibacteria bacterium]|nr:fibronectin type III domain-containing protein [candidate division Zixibacteria bacterium]
MKTIKILLSIVGCVILTIGCGPPRQSGGPAVSECAPTNLTVQSNDSTLYLKWDTNCPDEIATSGYSIYIEEAPIYEKYGKVSLPKKIKRHNHLLYPGDTDPITSFETMTINNLTNGIDYYVSVRAVFPDNTVTVSSNEVPTMCRPEGEFELAFRYTGQNDGFSFKNGISDRADGELNDLYFYHKEGFDFLATPKRLNGFIRDSKFYSLGKTKDIYQYLELDLSFDPVEKIPVMVGESYLVLTKEGNYAKIRIEEATGENKERKLKIKYIYQTVKELMRF